MARASLREVSPRLVTRSVSAHEHSYLIFANVHDVHCGPNTVRGKAGNHSLNFQRPRFDLDKKPGSLQSSSGIRHGAPYSRLSLPSTTFVSGSFPQSTDCSFLADSHFYREPVKEILRTIFYRDIHKGDLQNLTWLFVAFLATLFGVSCRENSWGKHPHMEDIPLSCLIAIEGKSMLARRH